MRVLIKSTDNVGPRTIMTTLLARHCRNYDAKRYSKTLVAYITNCIHTDFSLFSRFRNTPCRCPDPSRIINYKTEKIEASKLCLCNNDKVDDCP